MFCAKCGKDMGSGAFCPYCGAKAEGAAAPAVAVQARKMPIFAIIAVALYSLMTFINMVDYATFWNVMTFLTLQAVIVMLILRKELPMFIATMAFCSIELLRSLSYFRYFGNVLSFLATGAMAAAICLLMFGKGGIKTFLSKFFFIPAAGLFFGRHLMGWIDFLDSYRYVNFGSLLTRLIWTVAMVATYFFVVHWFVEGKAAKETEVSASTEQVD